MSDIILSMYQDNVPKEVVALQKEIVADFLARLEMNTAQPPLFTQQYSTQSHAHWMTAMLRGATIADVLLFLDIDCIPVDDGAIPFVLNAARCGYLVGAAQRSNHIGNGDKVFVGPCCLAISKNTWLRLGSPSCEPTARGDVAAELTYAAEEKGVDIVFLLPTRSDEPCWTYKAGLVSAFGIGTDYEHGFFHAFEIRTGRGLPSFLRRARQVAENQRRRAASRRILLQRDE